MGFAGDSLNLHRYCGNDPVNHMDPSGLDYDHDGRGDSDYAFDVRYDNQDDFLGWEAASYMRDVFARNDDASQRFDAYSVAIYEQSRIDGGSEGSAGNGISVQRAHPVLIDGHLVARAQAVSSFHIGVGQPIGILTPPNSGFAEAYNPTGRGWVYGWQASGYATLGGEAGYQVVVLENGQSAFYLFAGYGAGYGKLGPGYYEGTVSNVYWPSDFSGGFISVSANAVTGAGYSFSPSNGASSSGMAYGTGGASITVQGFMLEAVWWGH